MGDSDYNTDQSNCLCLEHGDTPFKELCPTGCQGGDSNDDYCIDSGSPRKLARRLPGTLN